MANSSGLIYGWQLNGTGGGTQLGWTDIGSGAASGGVSWLHLDRTDEHTTEWLEQHSGLDPIVIDALLAEETRPRLVRIGDGLLVILRGVNLNPGADPEDMVAVRLWVEEHRVISMRARAVMAVADIDAALVKGLGPGTPGELLTNLAENLVERMAPVVEDLDDLTDELEEQLVEGKSRQIRAALREVRRVTISLRRHLSPQRDVLARLPLERAPWLPERERSRLREVADCVMRYVEDLDEIRDRASVVQDELTNRLSEQMNRNMYLLSVVAAIMLPLGFLTGLLGINVGGIPGAESELGFVVVCALLALIGGLEVLIVRRLHWF